VDNKELVKDLEEANAIGVLLWGAFQALFMLILL